jgi:hypothetical protein
MTKIILILLVLVACKKTEPDLILNRKVQIDAYAYRGEYKIWAQKNFKYLFSQSIFGRYSQSFEVKRGDTIWADITYSSGSNSYCWMTMSVDSKVIDSVYVTNLGKSIFKIIQ